ncbi:GvpL/GvpF family gas vesicle protein [Streptomyces sp. WAC05374]|uniref:GvpL/GvpF family gas vesicle protein n=1 Tax=Streptomyces sp. WAC05374 TaxID=2487420 RepID=UPI000F893E4C|nr:GvpL/GvpF family gas vesicle protein [Streptomyces sp. WAC05374]RST15853.1 GvpL/GvpF family gas vesicle protein [Streptomyces sp. WAC05374]TDF46089.1 GvpL/GvpF family gas vesicle protein [Streptomyces sp. WAC05374]TDF53080.1 GvpL/GvpF family gas vesicle protein [Streptomyces sp. WAC05374]TDF58296.1 GvpL/GvpF family gas vesicle protein [Streptomyces sp. WAC05374]
MSGSVTYLYGVAEALPALGDVVAGLTGVAGAPVRVVAEEDLAGVVSAVPAADFEERPLAAHLEDLEWLEAVARAHHGVVDAVAGRATVLPLRLATIYRDDERVRDLLRTGRAAFRSRLSRLAGHVEWGVKVYADPSAAAPAPTGSAGSRGSERSEGGGPGGEELSPGRAYLLGRRRERTARDDAHRAAAEAAGRIHEAARAHAVEHVRHRVQHGPLVRERGENIGNDAYLVPVDASEAFLAAVREAAGSDAAVRAEVTGPWAPYSFAADAAVEPEEEATPG